MNKRRRCSSDGLRLFNMAIMEAPKYSKIKKMLSCLFHTEYDDRLEEMVAQCRAASQQLYAYTHHKDINTNKLIDNSIFNIINAILMNDEKLGSKFNIRRNYHYFLDVAQKASCENDHNTAILVRAALQHHALCQLKLKPRKRDQLIFDNFDNLYGSFRNCYKHHLQHAMFNTDYENYIPSLMVMNMHYERHKAYSTIGKCKLRYEPFEIKGRIGMLAIHHQYPGDKMPLYEQPPVGSSTDLIVIAQNAK